MTPTPRLPLVLAPLVAGLLAGVPAAAQTVTGTGSSTATPTSVTPGTPAPPGPAFPGAYGDPDQPSQADGAGLPLNPYAIPGAKGKPLGRTIVGQFNNDDWLDVVVLVEDQPIVLSGRDVYLSNAAPWESVLSLDTYPGAGPSGQDAVVYTDAAGLHFSWWDFGTKAFTEQLVDGDDWAGAKHVRVADVDGSGRVDVVGITADGRTLLVMSASGAAPPAFAPAPGFTADAEILCFTVLEWDGLGLPEVALVTDASLDVRGFDGSLLQQWAGVPAGGWLATMRQGYLPNDRLTWVTPAIPDPVTQIPAQSVFTVDKDTVDIAVDASGTLVTSAAGGDWDGDGDDDLIVGYGFSHDLVVLINDRSAADPTATSFSSASPAYFIPVGPPNTANPGQLANAVVGDFDNDGDVDAALAVESRSEFRIGKNDNSAFSDDVPTVTKLRYIVTEGSATGDLKIKLARPANVTSPSTELKVVQWRQGSLSGPSDATPVATDSFSIVRWPTEVTIQVPEPGQYFSSVYYLEMRFGNRNAQTGSTDYRSASLGGFTLSPLTLTELALFQGSGPPVLVVPEGDLSFNPGEVGSLGGAYIPNLRVPPTTGLNYQ